MLLVVIVNYRTPELALDCLRSLRDEIGRNPVTKVVVVDNDSRDGSAEIIARGIQTEAIVGWATLVRAPRNGGFAYGNNYGLAAAVEGRTPWGRVVPDLVWLMNPDTYVRPGAIGEALRFLDAHPDVGIAGTRVENADGSVWLSAFHFPTVWSELDHALAFGPFTRLIGERAALYPPSNEPRRVDWVSGASMIVRYRVIEQFGFLDEGYFMYYEETDFCLAAARAGVECWQVPQSRVVHLLGKSSGVTGAEAHIRRRPPYWFASRERYYRKNHGAAYLHLVNLLWCIAYPVGSLQRLLRRKPRQEPPHFWWDLLRYGYLGHRS
jgi:GT2 family glycosyltransferase